VTIADSHFLTVQFEERTLGAYYFGCPMTNYTKNAFLDHINVQNHGDKHTRTVVEKVIYCICGWREASFICTLWFVLPLTLGGLVDHRPGFVGRLPTRKEHKLLISSPIDHHFRQGCYSNCFVYCV
jgi:hypothetical protein